MAFEKVLCQIIEEDVTCSGIFSVGGDFNFTPLTINNATLPYACYTIWDDQINFTYDGMDGTSNVKCQISVYAETYAQSKETLDHIISAVDNYIRASGDLSISDCRTHETFDSTLKLYQSIADLYLMYFE